MLFIKNIRILACYSKWANSRILETIGELPVSEITKIREAAFDGILPTLAHMNIINRIWQGHLLGKDHGYTSRRSQIIDTLDQYSHQLNEIGDWYISYVNSLNEQELNEKVFFNFVDGGSGEMNRSDILLHMSHHLLICLYSIETYLVR
jgi:uncharacterized damage-inducible protein DinB